MGHIFFIMWVSWSWKWTLINNIKNSGLDNLHIPLSYRTRKKRDHEIAWVDSYFISKEQFYSDIQKWEFLEYWVPYDWDEYYGTKFEDVMERWVEVWKTVIKEIEINWLKQLRKEKPNFDEYYTTIFLNIPEDKLKERIETRWALMNDEELQRRKNTAIMENEKSKEICNYVIDATKSKEGVLEEALQIIENKIWKLI